MHVQKSRERPRQLWDPGLAIVLGLRRVRGVEMARLRVCAEPGCPELSEGRRCPAHASEREQARGSRHQRGYGAGHDARREALIRVFIPGTPCPKCGRPMWDTRVLDAGHSVDLREHPDAVADQLEHRACNRGWRRGRGSDG